MKAFLSCSVRPRDAALVNALARMLAEHGFQCVTIGRNEAAPEQVDDAVKQLVERCDCLIGLATTRLNATDVDRPTDTLRLATPYLVQETSAAHQIGLPFVVFKAAGVDLQGITNRNLWIEVSPDLSPNGRPMVKNKVAMATSLGLLREKALARKKKRSAAQTWDIVKTLATGAAGLWGLATVLDYASRPECFGLFYYLDTECRKCSAKDKCKVEKARLAAKADG
ncbi:MAG: hypothetical protein ABIO70_10320 [Pseudomonadota bacterium]